MHIRTITQNGLKIILAIILMVDGLNKFFDIYTLNQLDERAIAILSGFKSAGPLYILLGVYQIIMAIAIVINRTAAMALLFLLPFSLFLFSYHFILDKENIGMAASMLILNIYLGIFYIDYYKKLIIK